MENDDLGHASAVPVDETDVDRLLQAVEADPSKKRALLRRMGIEDQACDRTLSEKRGGTSEETPSGANAGPCWPQQTFPFPPPFWWPQPHGNCPPYAGACAWDQASTFNLPGRCSA